MTFTYTPASPTGSREAMRLKIGDTDSTNAIFTDEEMDLADIISTDLNTWAGNLMMAIASSQSRPIESR